MPHGFVQTYGLHGRTGDGWVCGGEFWLQGKKDLVCSKVGFGWEKVGIAKREISNLSEKLTFFLQIFIQIAFFS